MNTSNGIQKNVLGCTMISKEIDLVQSYKIRKKFREHSEISKHFNFQAIILDFSNKKQRITYYLLHKNKTNK